MRLFWAIPITEDLRTELARLQVLGRTAGLKASWPDPCGMHLTLAFLGEVEGNRIEELRSLGQKVTQRHARIEARTSGLGGFPSLRNAQVWWLGLEPCAELESLVKDLREELCGATFPMDRKPFFPHLTLARLKGSKDISGLGLPSEPMPLPIHHLALYQSRLTPQGAKYTVIGSASLVP